MLRKALDPLNAAREDSAAGLRESSAADRPMRNGDKIGCRAPAGIGYDVERAEIRLQSPGMWK